MKSCYNWKKCLYLLLMVFFVFTIQVCTAQASIISTKEEIAIGRNVGHDLEKKYGLVQDAALQARVEAIGRRLVAVCDRKDLPYTFKVLNNKDINALALPGGPVYLFKGLVDYMPSDDELAGVIAHEITHIVQRHSVKQMEKGIGVSIIFGLLFGNKGAFLQNLTYQALMAGYSRTDEREADRGGFKYTMQAGLNPYSIIATMQKLSDLENKPNYGLFSTHPDPEERLKLLRRYLTDNKVQPVINQKGKESIVSENDWKLPQITVKIDNYAPLYRSYFVAGRLYLVGKKADLNPNKFILVEEETGTTIYYENIAVLTLRPEDAAVKGQDLATVAAEYRDSMRQWAKNRLMRD